MTGRPAARGQQEEAPRGTVGGAQVCRQGSLGLELCAGTARAAELLRARCRKGWGIARGAPAWVTETRVREEGSRGTWAWSWADTLCKRQRCGLGSRWDPEAGQQACRLKTVWCQHLPQQTSPQPETLHKDGQSLSGLACDSYFDALGEYHIPSDCLLPLWVSPRADYWARV